MIACSALPQIEYDLPETEHVYLPALRAPAVSPFPLPIPDPLQVANRLAHAVPPYSLRLGVCAEASAQRPAGAALGAAGSGAETIPTAVLTGLVPLYLDLQNPQTGSILVTGDEGCGKTRLMQSMVAWALRDHSPRELQAAVIAAHERRWNAHMRRCAPDRQFRAVPDGGWPAERICLELASLVEQRLEGDPAGPVVLLVIDGLAPMLGSSHNVQAALRFLIDQGPLVGVRPIISLSTHQALNLHYWVSLFRTSLIGQISSTVGGAQQEEPSQTVQDSLAAPLLDTGFPLDALPGCPGQFVAVSQGESTPGWTRFWMLEPEAAAAALPQVR